MVFNHLALFFHHQNLLQTAGKFTGQLGFKRPNHGHFMQPNTQPLASGIVQAEFLQGLAGVVKGFAAGNQAKAVVLAFDHIVVEAVGTDIGQGRIPLVVEQPRLLVQRLIGPPDVNTALGHFKIAGHLDKHPIGIDQGGGA